MIFDALSYIIIKLKKFYLRHNCNFEPREPYTYTFCLLLRCDRCCNLALISAKLALISAYYRYLALISDN